MNWVIEPTGAKYIYDIELTPTATIYGGHFAHAFGSSDTIEIDDLDIEFETITAIDEQGKSIDIDINSELADKLKEVMLDDAAFVDRANDHFVEQYRG